MKYTNAAIVVCICGILVAFWCAVTNQSRYAEHQKVEKAEYEDKAAACQTRYKRLLKTKKVFIPVPIYSVTECETELETCNNALQAIKLWCNPECKQQLGECLDALRAAQDCNVSYYSYRRPM